MPGTKRAADLARFESRGEHEIKKIIPLSGHSLDVGKDGLCLLGFFAHALCRLARASRTVTNCTFLTRKMIFLILRVYTTLAKRADDWFF